MITYDLSLLFNIYVHSFCYLLRFMRYKYKYNLRIDKGSGALIHVIGSCEGTMSTTEIYISYESPYLSLSVHIWYITF